MLGFLDLPLIKEGDELNYFGIRLTSQKTKFYSVFGGPYRQKPSDMDGVKMAKEIEFADDGRKEIDVPTRDFNVPNPDDLRLGLIQAVDRIIAGKPVYVGCMGGKGRTGLFLAVLAKAFGIANPVEYVRAKYYDHAVETKQQYNYVMDFPIPPEVRSSIKWARRRAMFNPRSYKTNVKS